MMAAYAVARVFKRGIPTVLQNVAKVLSVLAVGTASGKYKLSGSMQGLENFRVKTAGQAQGNGTGLSAEGLPGMEFVLQVSTNLVNWINVSTQALATSSMELDVTNLMSLPQSFYRLRTTR